MKETTWGLWSSWINILAWIALLVSMCILYWGDSRSGFAQFVYRVKPSVQVIAWSIYVGLIVSQVFWILPITRLAPTTHDRIRQFKYVYNFYKGLRLWYDGLALLLIALATAAANLSRSSLPQETGDPPLKYYNEWGYLTAMVPAVTCGLWSTFAVEPIGDKLYDTEDSGEMNSSTTSDHENKHAVLDMLDRFGQRSMGTIVLASITVCLTAWVKM